MHTYMSNTDTLTVDGAVYRVVGHCLIYCDATQRFGRVGPWTAPTTNDDIMWYTPERLAEKVAEADPRNRVALRKGSPPPFPVTVDTVHARAKARWSYAEMVKPVGFERVADARRNGIKYDGVHRSLKEWSIALGVSVQVLEYRLAQRTWLMRDILSKGDLLRARSIAHGKLQQTGAKLPQEPLRTAQGGHRGYFYRNGRYATLRGHCLAEGISYATINYRLRTRPDMTLEQLMALPTRDANGRRVRSLTRSDKGKPNPKRGPQPIMHLPNTPEFQMHFSEGPFTEHNLKWAAIAAQEASARADEGNARVDYSKSTVAPSSPSYAHSSPNPAPTPGGGGAQCAPSWGDGDGEFLKGLDILLGIDDTKPPAPVPPTETPHPVGPDGHRLAVTRDEKYEENVQWDEFEWGGDMPHPELGFPEWYVTRAERDKQEREPVPKPTKQWTVDDLDDQPVLGW
jgi:hypothetical protein